MPRLLFHENWRPFMHVTREIACEMANEGILEITQKGKVRCLKLSDLEEHAPRGD